MATVAEIAAKGTGIRSSSEFISRRFGPETLSALVAALPPDARDAWPTLRPSAWYPVHFLGALWAGLARDVAGPDHEVQGELFRELGRYIAEDNLSTVYRLLLMTVWPDKLLEMVPRLWKTYFDGIRVEVEPDQGRRTKSGTVIVEGLGDLPFIGPVASGWLTRAYERAGARHVEVVESNWLEGSKASNRLVFTHRWA